MLSTQEKTYAELKSFADNGKIAGSWLITGPFGVGKSTLVRTFCGYLLTGKSEPIDFHADLKWIERDYTEDEKKEIIQTLNAGRELLDDADRARKSEIAIDDIRAGIQFLALTSANKNWRILVIDSADEMNENAANALLKLLEEPPEHSIIFLISHNMGKLLPTIRSRCRQVKLAPLSDVQMKAFIMENYPSCENMNALLGFFNGSIGKCVQFFEANGEDIYQKMMQIASSTQPIGQAYALAEAAAKDDTFYTLVKDLLQFYLLERIKQENENAALRQRVFDLWSASFELLRATEAVNLDKKSTLFEILLKLGELK